MQGKGRVEGVEGKGTGEGVEEGGGAAARGLVRQAAEKRCCADKVSATGFGGPEGAVVTERPLLALFRPDRPHAPLVLLHPDRVGAALRRAPSLLALSIALPPPLLRTLRTLRTLWPLEECCLRCDRLRL